MAADPKPTRLEAFSRGLVCKCPRCGESGLLKSYYKLHAACPHCNLSFEKEEGFTLGTTSIGYVLAIFFILIPLVLLAILGWIGTWTAILVGGLLSLALPIVLYPWLLGMVVGSYFALFGHEEL